MADHYHLQVATDGGFTALVIDKPDVVPSEYTPTSPIASNTKYYWRVQTYKQDGVASAWSAVRTFRTALPAPISLAQDGSVQDLRPSLTWDMTAYPLPKPPVTRCRSPKITASPRSLPPGQLPA